MKEAHYKSQYTHNDSSSLKYLEQTSLEGQKVDEWLLRTKEDNGENGEGLLMGRGCLGGIMGVF